jgi:uncharacterized protein YprB with RNaseH-like and TPR domain
VNIRDKLNRLDKSEASAGSNLKAVEENPLWIQDFQRELDAKILREQNSFIVLKENYYPLYDLKTLENLKMHDFRFSKFHHIAPEVESGELNLRKTIFVDLETTGLSGGTGTFAFLVGVGHIELDHIVARQYLLPDFQYEWLMLKLVENNFGDFSQLITFNGKSFDVPLLRTRFVMNRMESSLDQLQHIDLLHASRRLWKRRLTSCDLQNLEFAILGQTRIDDIPGEMIPQLYFEYIRKRNANLLRHVLEHNYHDIVNLVLLALHIAGVVNDPLAVLDEELDILSFSRFLFDRKNYSEAKPLLQFLIENGLNQETQIESMYYYSMLLKKSGETEESGKVFHDLLKLQRHHPEAIIELAKYYEHKEQNYTAALELIQHSLEGMAIYEQLEREHPLLKIREDLLYRRERLLSKNARSENQSDIS